MKKIYEMKYKKWLENNKNFYMGDSYLQVM